MLKNHSVFFKIFPPPEILSPKYAGLQITDDAIRAVVFSHKNGGTRISKFKERYLPKGLVESGYIKNENALAQEIKVLKEDLGLNNVRVLLPEEKMYLFRIDTPPTLPQNLRDYIETKLEENIPIPPNEAIFEFDSYEKKNGFVTKASVYAFPEKAIQSYLSTCILAGLDVVSFENEPRALSRALVDSSKKENIIIVNISEKKTGIYIVSSGVPLFSSTISIGGEAVVDSISKCLSISAEDALKKKYSDLYNETEQTKELFIASINTISAIKDEIEKVVMYWNTHIEESRISKICIVGHDASIVGFLEYLESSLKIPVSFGNVWLKTVNEKEIPPIDFINSLDYAVAIGLGLPEL